MLEYTYCLSENVINQEATFNLGIFMNLMGILSVMWWRHQ